MQPCSNQEVRSEAASWAVRNRYNSSGIPEVFLDKSRSSNIFLITPEVDQEQELEDIREAMGEQCREDGLTLYKVASTVDLVGIKAAMEEDELEKNCLGSIRST